MNSGRPLAAKLGIKPGSLVLVDGPGGSTFEAVDLGPMPDGVTLHRRAANDGSGPVAYPVIICFCPDRDRLVRRWPMLHPRTTTAGALWIAWPKRASGIPTDLDDQAVRDHALTHGRVDVLVCAIDTVWSGLKTVVRLADR